MPARAIGKVRLLRLALVIAVLALVGRPAQAALVIDGFDSGEPFEIENVGFGASITQPADVLGGERAVVVNTRAVFDPLVGLDLIKTSIASAARVSLTYQAGGADLGLAAGYFELDLAPVGAPCLSCNVTALVVVYHTAGSAAWSVSGPPFGTLTLPYNPISLSALEVLLEVTFEGNPGDGVRLIDFRAVPEPAVGATLALAAFALLLVRRRASVTVAALRVFAARGERRANLLHKPAEIRLGHSREKLGGDGYEGIDCVQPIGSAKQRLQSSPNGLRIPVEA